MLNLKNLVEEARTCRRFVEGYHVSYETLEELVDIARLTPSARNGQVLRYALINTKETCDLLSQTFRLGGGFKEEDKPQKGDEPNAYIAILGPDKLTEWATMDIGICGQTIQLAATEKGLATCMIGAYNGEKALEALVQKGLNVLDPIATQKGEAEIPLRVRLLIALGKPNEKRTLREVSAKDTTNYYRENKEHIVPKRALSDVVIFKS